MDERIKTYKFKNVGPSIDINGNCFIGITFQNKNNTDSCIIDADEYKGSNPRVIKAIKRAKKEGISFEEQNILRIIKAKSDEEMRKTNPWQS